MTMMRPLGDTRSRLKMPILAGQAGSTFVALLLALLIGGTLLFVYVEGPKVLGERSAGTAAVDVTKEVACRTTRQLIEREIGMWEIGHPGEQGTLEALERDHLRVPPCPEGGTYSLVDRHVECSLHQ